MHLEVTRQRPDVQAVVHAHPPIATGFAVAGILLDRAVLAEVLTTLGAYRLRGTHAVHQRASRRRARTIKAHDGMLLANHGALTVGVDLFSAYFKMETIEHFAKISLWRGSSGENLIAREEVLQLQELRGTYGDPGPGADLRRSIGSRWRRRVASAGASGIPGDLPGGAGAVGQRSAAGA